MPAPDNSARFTSMDITFVTGDDDKDGDTRLEVFIAAHDGAPAVAYLDIGSNTLFDDHQSYSYKVPSFQAGFTRGDLANEVLIIKIAPNGTDHWSFYVIAKLHFSDGTTASLQTEYIDLGTGGGITAPHFNATNNQVIIPLSAAT
jgi:hypothetical protein